MTSLLDATFDDLLGLSENDALLRHHQGVNYSRLRTLAIVASFAAFAYIITHLLRSSYRALWAPLLILVSTRGLFMIGDNAFFARYFRWFKLFGVLGLLGLLAVLAPSLDTGLRLLSVLGPLMLAAFKWWPLDAMLASVTLWSGSALVPTLLRDGGVERFVRTPFLVATAVTLVCLYFSLAATRRTTRRFMQRFRIETTRNRERIRMRQELDYARQIQLSMLPRRDPTVAGLDVASVSLPAMEVGGDYYEYFQRPDGRYALVIGDVAGHGVASGLLLSGIRSCLYLLHPENPSPSRLFERLDRMVRETTERRMFITLQYAIVDSKKGRLRFASAGHPPILHYRNADEEVVELATAAPPLGTRLESRYREIETSLAPGDVLVFYTDGLIELTNNETTPYDDRLAEKVRQTAATKSARGIREAILGDLWNFKGNEEQHDDITLVVIKLDSKSSQEASEASSTP